MKYQVQNKKRFALFITAILLIPISIGYFTYRYFTAPVAVALENVSAEQKTELIGSVFGRNLELFKFTDSRNEKKQTGDIALTTFDEKDSGSKESNFIFPEKYQDGYKFIQDGIEIIMKPKNIDADQYERKVSSIAKFDDEKKQNTGQFLSYEKKVETRFIASDSREKHIFALSRDNNTLKQWSLYEKYQNEITEEWEFQNAYLKKTEGGSIEVYKAPVKKESQAAMQNLEPDMAERIAATLKEEMGDDYYFQGRNLLFTIPKPYLITKQGENKDADTQIENQNILKIKVKANKDEFPILLDPTITLAAKMDYVQINGDSASDYFGSSVSGAGDVNGDGKDDVIVGAYLDDDNGSDSGSAFIFYGGAASGTASTAADVKITGDGASDYFGFSVSGAGDINGDGKDDVIVGAYQDDDSGSASGSAFIFYGGVVSGTASLVANVKLTGDSAGDWFGYSASGAGDINGDGKDDVIVGARSDDDMGGNSGSAFIFYGGAVSGTASTAADVKITGDSESDCFGTSVSGAGDMNGDGKDDVIVGAYADDDGGENSGSAFIFYGGAVSGTASTAADVKITGDSESDYFGEMVSFAGDMNGDGKDDVIVGAYADDDGGENSGSAFIFYGGVTSGAATAKADVKLTGDSAGDNFGWSVSGAGDVNGDGKDDVIVGARGDDDGGLDSGSTFIFYGGVTSGTATVKADVKLIGQAVNSYDYFGYSVSCAGDINGDGKSDVIIGAIYDDDGGSDSGSAKIYTFNDFQNSAKLIGDSESDYFGSSVSGAGDMNGDGKDDVIVGAYADDDGGSDSGSAFIFYGGVSSGSATAKADVKLTGDSAEDYFGYSVSGAGDVNGDGKDDVIVGAYRDDDGGSDSGSAFIFCGGVTSGSATTKADVKLTGDSADDRFGISVSGAGDINGDGLDDVIVGTNQDDDGGSSSGSAFIFYGGVTSGAATAKADVKLTGDSAEDYFGSSVSGAGDVNGDGKDDVIVGADGDDDGGSSSGSAFIFYGGVTSGAATTKADVKLTGDSESDYFGISASGAGDVNGDGKDDVIVGAHRDDDGGESSGSAFIFCGGVTSGAATTKADVKLTGDGAYDTFGIRVSSAGDMNGDGKDDVIVGAYADDDGGSDSGSAFIFTQGPSGEMQKYDGESAGDQFGYSVSSAGDMDGDGLDDVIVGANGNSSATGAVYIFYGNKISGTAAMSYDVKINGDGASNYFGISVSGAGDINGDGKDDVIVGAQGDDDGGSDSGSAFIFYGGVVSGIASTVADVKITGDSAGDYFGSNVSGAGDVNGDGKDDVIVGATGYSSFNGAVYIFYGGVTSGSAASRYNVRLTGDSADDYFGISVSGAGDINGDGKDDVIVGADGDDDGGSSSGSAFIFYGGVTSGAATTKADVKLTGDSSGDYFGISVSGAGDMNGDGKNDVIVGAPYDDDGSNNSGSAFIFYGGVASGAATSKANVKLTGDSESDWFGDCVSGAGDVNGDGKNDVIVGSDWDDDGGSNSGSAFIFYGGVSSGAATTKADVKLTGDSANDYFGTSVSGAGDVNGDGKEDIIAGAPYDDDGGADSGSIKIITDLATKDNPDSPNFQINGDGVDDHFGWSVSGAGDVNGDGKDDVIVGAYKDDDGGSESGSAFIFYGGVISGAATAKADVKLTGDSAEDGFGRSVSGAGDVNGDGKDDVIVGAYADDDDGSASGSAFIFYGGVSSGAATAKADVKLTGDSESDYFSTSVSAAGDVNGDGKDDVIVGASGDDDGGSDSGSAFIFYGGVSSGAATAKADVKLTGDSAGDAFGHSVSGAGDINGDGKDDVIVGADGDDDGGSSSGSAFIFYGGVTSGAATTKADVKLTGDSASDHFGYSVSEAGDMNGDGKDDVIVGADEDDDGGSYSGSAFIFYSGATSGAATAKADVKLTGNSASDYFGISVSGAGDMNGDGLDDVIVGADMDYSSYGSAHIFYGHRMTPEMPTTLTPTSGTYSSGQNIDISCSGGTYNTLQDKYGQTIIYDIESFYSGQWHEVVSGDADGSYSYNIDSVSGGSGLKLRCRSEIDGLLGGFSRWYEPSEINLTVIQRSKKKIEGRTKFEGNVKME